MIDTTVTTKLGASTTVLGPATGRPRKTKAAPNTVNQIVYRTVELDRTPRN
jgi:hypothetical protein